MFLVSVIFKQKLGLRAFNFYLTVIYMSGDNHSNLLALTEALFKRTF